MVIFIKWNSMAFEPYTRLHNTSYAGLGRERKQLSLIQSRKVCIYIHL